MTSQEDDCLCAGLDLGTTYSSLGYYNKGEKKVTLIEEDSTNNFASHICITKDENGNEIVSSYCNKAKDDRRPHFYDSKRLIGKKYEEYEKMDQKEKDHFSFKVNRINKNEIIMSIDLNYGDDSDDTDDSSNDSNNSNDNIQNTKIERTPIMISSMIVEYLMMKLKATNQRPINRFVVTIPVDFNQDQIEATKTACKMAIDKCYDIDFDIKKITTLFEPVASIIAYHFIYGMELKIGTNIIVLDFGGGTFDISCCEVIEDPESKIIIEKMIKAKTSGSDKKLGGNNCDKVTEDIESIKNIITENMIKVKTSGGDQNLGGN